MAVLSDTVALAFFADLLAADDKQAYMERLEACGRDVACVKASGRPYNEWNKLNDAIRSYSFNFRGYSKRTEEVVRQFADAVNKYPVIRRIASIAPGS